MRLSSIVFSFFSNTSAKTTGTRITLWTIHSDSLTHMMRTKSKEPGCQIIQNLHRRGTSMVSSVGLETSTSSAQRTITSCTRHIASSSMAPRTITTPLTTLPWPIMSSSGKMPRNTLWRGWHAPSAAKATLAQPPRQGSGLLRGKASLWLSSLRWAVRSTTHHFI